MSPEIKEKIGEFVFSLIGATLVVACGTLYVRFLYWIVRWVWEVGR